LTPATAAKSIPNEPAIDTDAIIAVNLSRMKVAQERYASENGSLRSTFAKAEQQGVHLKAAKRALQIVKAGDVDAWLTETSKVTTYLKILRHGVTENQLSLDLESTLAPIEEKAGLDGRSMGLDTAEDATEHRNPHDLSTRAGQAWLSAFRQGRTERDIILSMKDDEPEDDIDSRDDAEDDED
jgi:hypothetical protein